MMAAKEAAQVEVRTEVWAMLAGPEEGMVVQWVAEG
jgi:hypothetical protein